MSIYSCIFPCCIHVQCNYIYFQLSESALQHQLTKLQTGAVKDGPTYIYKIWKSLLNKWFSDGNYHVFIATPFLDSDRLDDICKLVLKNKLTASVDALYVRRQCDIDKDISDVKRTTQQRFAPQDQVFIEYKIYSSIIYPLTHFHAKFIAGIKDDRAEVLITSANFHAENFVRPNAENIMYGEMSASEFTAKYLRPITASVSM